MEKKKIIEIVVVIGAFLGSGLILYNSFSGGAGPAPAASSPALMASATPAGILPYGQTFNYQQIDDLQKQGFEFGQVQYPALSTSTEVGKAADELITSLPNPLVPK